MDLLLESGTLSPTYSSELRGPLGTVKSLLATRAQSQGSLAGKARSLHQQTVVPKARL